MIAGLITLALFALAIALLAEPRGRHHVHARLLARPFERERITVDQLIARIERERPMPVAWLSIEPSVEGFRAAIRDELAGIAG